jgi:hypothetical protein
VSEKPFKARKGLAVNTDIALTTVHIASNDAILLPAGATADRPASLANGMLRYNTTTSLFEGYANSAWANLSFLAITGTNTQLFYNDSGALGAAPGLIYNKTTNNFSVANSFTTVALNATGLANLSGNVAFSLMTSGNSTVNVTANSVGYYRNAMLQGAGKQTVWIPGGAFTPATTDGAASVVHESATNRIVIPTMAFSPTVGQKAFFTVRMPKSWNESTVTFAPVWYHAPTTTPFGVTWDFSATSYSDANTIDIAFTTEVTVSDTGGVNNAIYIGPESSALTIGNSPVEGDFIVFRIARDPADGSDTLAVNAHLVGIHLYITTNETNDA